MINLTNVTKTYGKHEIISDLHLCINAGQTVGFVGANGAGKTTTIRLMLGFLRPTAGSVHLMGCNMNDSRQAQSIRHQIGFVPDSDGLDPILSGQRLLDELASLQKAPPVDRSKIVESLQLAPRDLKRPIGRLSRGTRQKINLIQGLQHRPQLLILDEPTEGLDPFAKRALFELLHKAKARGTTIFFSSHVLSELEGICDEVALIRQGRLVDRFKLSDGADATLHQVRLRLGDKTSDVAMAAFVEQLRSKAWVMALEKTDTRLSFQTDSLAKLLELLSTLPVVELNISPLSIEERVMPHYGS